MSLTVAQYVGPHHDIVDAAFESKFSNVTFLKVRTEDELTEVLPRIDALITGSRLYTPTLGAKVVELAKHLRWIQFTTVGMDGIALGDLPQNAVFTNARGARTKVIAGHAIALMLAVMRGFRKFQVHHERHVWAREEIGQNVTTTDGKTIVIVGMGDVGHDIARKAKAFDFKVIGVSRAAQAGGPVDEVVPRSKLLEVLPSADVAVMSAASDDSTYHIMGAREIGAMKPSAIVVNVARGALIDEAALIEALRERRIFGAGLDVTEIEPLPAESGLWNLDNVVLSPHVAGAGAHSQKLILAELISDNLMRFQQKKPLRNLVT